jgi:hypothetical protein
MKLFRHLARLAALTTLLGSTAVLVAAASPAASAATVAGQEGWVRIAHLSPAAPAMDIYMYPFSNPGHPVVLRDVSYGDVSAYMAVSPGQYTVAMRGFGAPASSHPALQTSFMVGAGTAYTVGALGPDPGLRVEILQDRMAAAKGQVLVRVVQASLKQSQVTVSLGSDVLARTLNFGAATTYAAVSSGEQTVQVTAPGVHTTTSVELTAGTIHTIVVLDDSSGLKVANLTDAVGSQLMPKGGAAAGFGGTAAHGPASAVPWLLTIVFGALLTVAGFAHLRRPRPVAAVQSC